KKISSAETEKKTKKIEAKIVQVNREIDIVKCESRVLKLCNR
ncbi:unnamed protein product, partial [Arabidopsis halleri]